MLSSIKEEQWSSVLPKVDEADEDSSGSDLSEMGLSLLQVSADPAATSDLGDLAQAQEEFGQMAMERAVRNGSATTEGAAQGEQGGPMVFRVSLPNQTKYVLIG